MNNKNKAPVGELALLGMLALLWGSSYYLTKIAVGTIPPVTLIAVRVSIAAIFLVIVVFVKGDVFPKDKKTWRMLLLQSFFNSIGGWTLLAWGQQYVDSALASVLNSTSPIFVFFFTVLVTRHEKMSSLKLVGACLGVFGVALIVGADALQGIGQQVMAQIAVLGGAALYACAAIYGKRFSHLPPTITAAGTMLCASICLIPLSFVFENPMAVRPATEAVLAIVFLGVVSTGIALLVYFRLVQTLGSMGVASQSYLRAGVGVILGVVLLGEHITPVMGLGLAAAILGVAAINTPTRTKELATE
ncbi:EamA family transporter [Alphaproteobacteria bacterium 46_93_T64]|nr:EamA family transporter [Alphaproteobacteria bacterium 46_93_T64]